MSDLSFASLGFAMVIGMSGISDRALAHGRPQAVHRLNSRSAAETFVFVPSDTVLVQMGQTRVQNNAASPQAEHQWRAAWAAQGTKADNGVWANIRSQSAAPKAMRKAVP